MACSVTAPPRGRAIELERAPDRLVRALQPTEATIPLRLQALLAVAEHSQGRSAHAAADSIGAALVDAALPSDLASAPAAPPVSAADCPATMDQLERATDVELVAEDGERLRGPAVLVAAKAARRLLLYEAGALRGCWPTALGFDPVGHKAREGDGRTPLGWYPTSDKPWSTFDDAIAIHYPNAADADAGLTRGTISRRQHEKLTTALRKGNLPPQRTPLGGALLIHGGGSGGDWTLGCIALDDDDLGELRAALPSGMRADLLIAR